MIYELLALSEVLQAVEKTGTQVRYRDERCNQEVSGFYKYGPATDLLVICPDNHVNHSDLLDTIRHEAMHVVQACKGAPVLSYDYLLKNATTAAKEAVSQYPKDLDTQHHELEAFTAAEVLSEGDIVELIGKFCFE